MIRRINKVFLSHLSSIILICIVGYISYSNTFSVPFVFDDIPYILNNERFKHLPSLSELWIWQPTRFIPHLTLASTASLSNFSLPAFHIVNLLLHVCTAIIVYYFIKIIHSDKFIAVSVALLFIVHPIQTQAVTYIMQRTSVIAALFYILTLLLYLKKRYLFSLLIAICAFLSKENTYTLPIAILLIEYFFPTSEKKTPARFLKSIPYVIPAMIFYGVSLYTTSSTTPLAADTHVSRIEYMATQPSVILTYIRLLFIPMNQSIDYDFLVVHTFADPRFIIPAIIILLTLILAIAIRKKFPYISFGILFFFLTLSIESSIIPIPDMIVEHRLYLPSVGFFLACIAGILQLLQTKNMTALSKYAFPILIGLCMALTFQRNTVWQSELSLWQDASTKSPQKIRPHLAYAISLKNAHQPDQSLQEFLYTHSLLTTKNLPKEQKNAWYLVINQHLAEMYALKKEYKEAIRYQQEMITIDPTDGWLYENLGMLHAQNNDLNSAHDAFTKAILLSPTASAYYNDGVILTHLGRYNEARTAYTKALELKLDLFQAKQNLDRLP